MTASTDSHYNLIDQPWIPILWANGRAGRAGIQEALAQAGRIRQIAASNPMDNVALLRFLMAVLLWCKEDVKDAFETTDSVAVGVPGSWLAKLAEHKDAFNLLGDGKRFYQDASLKGRTTDRPVADLLAEFPGADSVNHMRHVVHDGSYGFCPACCALGILRLSVWAPANKFYPASVNPASAVYTIVHGGNLLVTLRNNLPAMSAQGDQAPWLLEQAPESPGTVARLAWRPRKLWLKAATDIGVCANCGLSAALITGLYNEGGWATPVTAGQEFSKDVETAFKEFGYAPKGKDPKSKKFKKAVERAPVLFKCRMESLTQVYEETGPEAVSLAEPQSPKPETDAHKLARMFARLVDGGSEIAIEELLKKATEEERTRLESGDTKTKKFWDADPHLVKSEEAVALPGLSKDVAAHASRFWRDALRQRPVGSGKTVAAGPMVNKFIFQDARSVELPEASAQARAQLSADCGIDLDEFLKNATPNSKRFHPEIKAAVVSLTPETEEQVRVALSRPDPRLGDEAFLRELYVPLVDRVLAATTPGSLLRRREALDRAQNLLNRRIESLTRTRGGDGAKQESVV